MFLSFEMLKDIVESHGEVEFYSSLLGLELYWPNYYSGSKQILS